MAEFLPLFLGLTFIGFVWALPVLIPPLRRWLRGRDIRRLTAVLMFSGSLLYIIFLVISFLNAQFSTLLICNPTIFWSDRDWDTTADERAELVVCNDEKAALLGFAHGADLETAVNQEIFRRNRTPPPFRRDCYADNPAFCEFVSPSSIEGNNNLLGLMVASWPTIVTGLLVWLWTRPSNSESILAKLIEWL